MVEIWTICQDDRRWVWDSVTKIGCHHVKEIQFNSFGNGKPLNILKLRNLSHFKLSASKLNASSFPPKPDFIWHSLFWWVSPASVLFHEPEIYAASFILNLHPMFILLPSHSSNVSPVHQFISFTVTTLVQVATTSHQDYGVKELSSLPKYTNSTFTS